MTLLAGDIGGTKTLLGLGEAGGSGVRTQPPTARSLRNALAAQPANRRRQTA